MSRLLFVLFFTLLTLNASRATALSFAGLEAYKLELESHLDSKIRQAVKPVLLDEQYSLAVTVELKSTAEISKLLPSQDELNNAENSVGEDKAEVFTFVESKPNDEEVLLPLTKLGLWQRKVAIDKVKAKSELNGGQKKATESFLSYRDFVSVINVNMFLDRKLPAELVETVERVVRGSMATTDGRLNVQFGKLTIPDKVDPKDADKIKEELAGKDGSKDQAKDRKPDAKEDGKNEEKPMSWIDFLIEFKMPLALLVCTLTLFALGLVVTSNLNKLSARKMNIMEKQAEREDAVFKSAQFREEEQNIRSFSTGIDLNEKEFEEKRQDVRGKLISFIDSKPHDAAMMVRRWVLFRGEGSTEALNLLARTLTVNQMAVLIDYLTEEDRRSWNLAVTKDFGPREEKIALVFVESQMLVNIIFTTPNVDEELKSLVYSLSLNDIVAIVRKNQELGAVLLLFLQSAQLAKVFEVLDVDMVARVSQLGVQFSPKIVESKSKELLELIKVVKAQMGVRSPFVDRLQGLLQEVTPDKEGPLFFAMATQLDRKSFLEFARTHLPAELIPRIPLDLLKKTMASFSLVRRAEMIIAQDQDRKDFLLSLVGEGKAREVLSEEIDSISLEPHKANLLRKNADGMWRQFIQNVRSQTADDARRGDLDELLGAWIDSLSQKGKSNARRAA